MKQLFAMLRKPGWKTYAGIALMSAAKLAELKGFVDPATAAGIFNAGAGLAGVGVVHKFERALRIANIFALALTVRGKKETPSG